MSKGDVMIETNNLSQRNKQKKPIVQYNDFLDEYDHYYLDHEKYLLAGNGGKQRFKKEVEQNSNKYDPSGNVRIIINKMQNFEQKRRKSSNN